MEHSLLVLSALAGAIHVMAPDHWMPLSLSSWQRQWRSGKTLAFSMAALGLHIGAGFVLFLALRPMLVALDEKWLLHFAVTWIVAGAAIRAFRFGRIRDVLRMGPNRIWSTLTVMGLLGPSESLVPILFKAHHLGAGYLSALAAFALGTGVSGLALIFGSRLAWNHPARLIRGVSWAQGRRSALPVVVGVTTGIIFLLKL